MESGRTRESIIACTIKHLMESGTVTYEASGWGQIVRRIPRIGNSSH